MVPALLATLLFSISGVSGARATKLLVAPLANLLRFVVALVVLAAFAFFFGQGLTGPGLWIFLLSGFIGFGLGDTALFEAYARIGSRRTILLTQALAAPIAALTEFLWLGERLDRSQVLCIGLIVFGVCLAMKPSTHQPIPKTVFVLGVLCGIGAAFGQGWGAVLSRKAFAITQASGFEISAMTVTFQRLLGGIALPMLLVFRHWRRERTGLSRTVLTNQAISWCVLTGLAGPVFGVACFQAALSGTSSGIVLAIIATTPLMIMPLSWWSEGDRPTLGSLLGGLLAVLGVVGLFLK